MKVTIELDEAAVEKIMGSGWREPTFVRHLVDEIRFQIEVAERENAKGGVVIYEYDTDGRRWNVPEDLRSAPSVFHADGASYCLGRCDVPGRHQIVFEAPMDYAGEITRSVHLLSIAGDGRVRWVVSRDPTATDREAIRAFRLR